MQSQHLTPALHLLCLQEKIQAPVLEYTALHCWLHWASQPTFTFPRLLPAPTQSIRTHQHRRDLWAAELTQMFPLFYHKVRAAQHANIWMKQQWSTPLNPVCPTRNISSMAAGVWSTLLWHLHGQPDFQHIAGMQVTTADCTNQPNQHQEKIRAKSSLDNAVNTWEKYQIFFFLNAVNRMFDLPQIPKEYTSHILIVP